MGRLADEPFLHVGVQSDKGLPEEVQELVDERGITWPTVIDRAVDGGSFGPIGAQGNLSGWPTVFLIEHEGEIRSGRATETVLDGMLPGIIEAARVR